MAEVKIKDMKYSPNPVKVAPGEPVYWVNEEDDEDMVHTATADKGAGNEFDTGNLNGNGEKSKEFTFDKTTSYYCKKHPKSMKGVVEVQA